MAELIRPVYFKVMGRGTPRIPICELPKFNIDLIAPPPYLAIKLQARCRGRGRGRVVINENSLVSVCVEENPLRRVSSSSSIVEKISDDALNHYATESNENVSSLPYAEDPNLHVSDSETNQSCEKSGIFTQDELNDTLVEVEDVPKEVESALISESCSTIQEGPRTSVIQEIFNDLEGKNEATKPIAETVQTLSNLSGFTHDNENLMHEMAETEHLNIPVNSSSSQSYYSMDNSQSYYTPVESSISPESEEKLSPKTNLEMNFPGFTEENQESDIEKYCHITPVNDSRPQSTSPILDDQTPDFLNLAIDQKLNRFKKNNDASESVPNFQLNYSKRPKSSQKQSHKVPKNSQNFYKKNRNNFGGTKKTILLPTPTETDSSDSTEKGLAKSTIERSMRYQQFSGYQDQRSPSPYHHLDPRSVYNNPIPLPQICSQKEFPSLEVAASTDKKDTMNSYSSICKKNSLAEVSSILRPLASRKSSSESLSSDSSASRFLDKYKTKVPLSLTSSSVIKEFVVTNVIHKRCEENLREFLSQFGEIIKFQLSKEEKLFTAYIRMHLEKEENYENLFSTLDGISASQVDPNHCPQEEDTNLCLKLIQRPWGKKFKK